MLNMFFINPCTVYNVHIICMYTYIHIHPEFEIATDQVWRAVKEGGSKILCRKNTNGKGKESVLM